MTELCRMLIVSCELIYDDVIRACAVSTVTADRTGKLQPNSISLFYRSSFGWCTFSALTWLAPGDEAKLQCTSEKSRLMWMQKNTPVPRLNKGISCQEKGDKTAVLNRVTKGVAKLRSVVATATPGQPLAPPLPPGTCSKGDEAMLRYFREEEEN